jgi:F0F1-type ATP synthase alpha subunit
METQGREVLKAIRESKELNEETEKQLKEAISNFKQSQV